MISLRLQDEVIGKLNEIAKKEKRTRTDIVKEALSVYFEKKKIKIPAPKQKARKNKTAVKLID
jgi:predicted transcriptional regulator